MAEDRDSCWYQQYVVDEMNRFYDMHGKNPEVTKHFSAFSELLSRCDEKGNELMDLGCGTAMLSEFCKDYKYHGTDLKHVITGCALRNYPEYEYRDSNIIDDDILWIKEYPVVVMNAVIDIMEKPLEMLEKVLQACNEYLIIHRQEITEHGQTHVVRNGSYGGYTYHSE